MAGKFQPPPIKGNKVLTDDGLLSDVYQRWLELIPPRLDSPANSGSVPTAANSQGIAGQIATDGNFIYVCVAANQWKRSALIAF